MFRSDKRLNGFPKSGEVVSGIVWQTEFRVKFVVVQEHLSDGREPLQRSNLGFQISEFRVSINFH